MENEIRCPKCGSTQISANKKGFSGGKALGGAILTGGVGLLAGTIGKDKIILTCLNCGHQFKPGQDKKNLEKKKKDDVLRNQQSAEAMKKPGFWIFLIVLFVIFFLILKSCFDGGSTTTTNPKANIEQKQSVAIDVSNIDFEILNQSSDNGFSFDVYVKNKSDIQKLNDYFVNKYNSNGQSYMNINYFDNKEIGADYFVRMRDSQYTEKEKDGFFSHYIASYKYNPTSNYKNLSFMHK